MASIKHWTLSKMDVSNAFLHGDLAKNIFMASPPSMPKDDARV